MKKRGDVIIDNVSFYLIKNNKYNLIIDINDSRLGSLKTIEEDIKQSASLSTQYGILLQTNLSPQIDTIVIYVIRENKIDDIKTYYVEDKYRESLRKALLKLEVNKDNFTINNILRVIIERDLRKEQ